MRLLLLFVLLINLSAKAVVVTVGSDAACDYTSITSASINEPPSDILDIKLAKNFNLTGFQLLTNRHTSIQGGYDTCADTTQSGRTVLNGDGFNGAIFVASENTNTGSWQMTLFNSLVHDNLSNQDGGAFFLQPSTTANVLKPKIFLIGNSVVNSNSARNGGAVACNGSGELNIWNMQMSGNTASENGGAVYVNNGCVFNQLGGGFLQGILLNSAITGFGGGIAAFDDAIINIQSNIAGLGLAAISSNSAAYGGGIAVLNGATLNASDASINNNTASESGGGILSSYGRITIQRVAPGAQCHNEVRCSVISGNSVSGTDAEISGGGAIFSTGGTLTVTGTYIEHNSAFYGSAIRARNMPLTMQSGSFVYPVKFIGNVVAKNLTAPQVIFVDNSAADIAFSTFVDNEDMDRVIELAVDLGVGNPDLRVSGSIFEHPGSILPSAELTTEGPIPLGDCNRNESNSTGDLIGQPRSSTAPVFFENRSAGDYRLLTASEFIDFCNWSILGTPSNVSANGLPKPIDHPLNNNLYGTYDLGGLERYEFDLIFANGLD